MQRLALLAGLGLALAALWVLGGGEPPAPRSAPLSSGAPAPAPERSPTRPTRRVPLPAGSRALPSPEPAPRGPRSLRGRVLDEAGQPIAGARVALRALPAGPVQGVVCDEAGAFAFSAAPSGPLELIAIAEGWALPAAPERLGPEAAQATLTLRRLTLRGRVVGELPRPDLRVEALPNGEGIALSAPVEAGAFELPLPASGVWWLRARQEGAASPWLRVEVDERSPSDLELALAALAELRGVVRDEQGRPLAGAEVVARDRVGRERRALSDAEGGFRLEACADEHYRVAAHPPAGRPLAPALREVWAPASSLELELDRLVPLTLAPFRTRGGEPVRGALTLDPGAPDGHDHAEPRLAGEVPFDERGLPDLSGLPPGRWTLSFREEAGDELRAWVLELEVPHEGPAPRVAFVDPERHALEGVVRGLPRDPGLVQVELRPQAAPEEAFAFLAARAADAEGRFCFAEVPPGRYVLCAQWGETLARREVEVSGARVWVELGD